MIKVGDNLVCIKDYKDGGLLYTAGYRYKVDSIRLRYNDYEIIIVSNNELSYYFLLNDKNSEFYFGRYFSNILEIRRKKLNKLEKLGRSSRYGHKNR